MDQGDGTFAPLSQGLSEVLAHMSERIEEKRATLTPEDMETLWPRLFVVGHEVEIRQSRFRIEYIGTDVLVLKLLPAERPAG